MERVVPINKTFQDFFGFHFLLRMERKEEETEGSDIFAMEVLSFTTIRRSI